MKVNQEIGYLAAKGKDKGPGMNKALVKCDRCGKFYIFNFDHDNRTYVNGRWLDLCPRCADRLQSWLDRLRRTNKSNLRKTVDMPEIPKTCDECPFHYTRAYQCHNERGLESFCDLGYMYGYDTRDFCFNKYRFEHCQLERDYVWENDND